MLFPIVPATLFFMIKRTQPEVGSLVIDRRKRLRMDASELAVLADVDPKTLRSLERGDRWPREATRLKIEHALHWRAGALDSLRAGGAAFAVDGLAAIDPVGDELFYPDSETPDVHENSAQTVAAQQVLSQVTEIGDALDRQPDTTSARADGRIRSAIKLQESAIDALIRSDRQQAIGDLDTSIVVLQSTISILKNEEAPNDVTTESTTEGRKGEAPQSEKTRGRGSLPDKIRDAGERLTTTRTGRAVADSAHALDISQARESSDDVLRVSYDDEPPTAAPTSNASEQVEDRRAAARRGIGKSKGEKLRDRDAQLGEGPDPEGPEGGA
ncbi:immunity repressor [Gordonia phage Ohgeesy]|uniref:Immunity repressor n=1 Tax=Gordonia phage Ohgeesy TaxID=2762412 RepID=A0A7G8LGA1_9CAUD|nr:transcriptional regulator [Gordonia phage Ohgeesy]QNJ56273.1 immunity repressor [Gordonia phage Ohgeesy]